MGEYLFVYVFPKISAICTRAQDVKHTINFEWPNAFMKFIVVIWVGWNFCSKEVPQIYLNQDKALNDSSPNIRTLNIFEAKRYLG